MLLANNISFYRNNNIIFKDVSLALPPQKIINITGANGIGKTTLLKILTHVLIPKKGNIFWNGKNIKKNLFNYYKDVTFVMDKQTSNINLSVIENIFFWKKLFSSIISKKEIDAILDLLSLDNYRNTPINYLSNGEIKKLELTRLVIERKKLWMLDEPYIGLDIETINLLNETFINHTKSGGMIIFSSHYVPDIPNIENLQLENYAQR
ncbi:MAG: heme ABC exporter ATP-binding protein CcmA [Alphaproteobacteria bacterium]|jgi:heme exporter protein A|nr:heme ABC exporter ATP-binding protein CcmA [Alphaproteobacteria bacterium]PPR57074.1 MAG: Cytochrome c biogenesis ATP-binding export protein CcmA [Alphaproteobacteria bacterium MarineAlpha5_Bin3]